MQLHAVACMQEFVQEQRTSSSFHSWNESSKFVMHWVYMSHARSFNILGCVQVSKYTGSPAS